jgi:hypothetical protein
VARAHDRSIGEKLRQPSLVVWGHPQAALSCERAPPRKVVLSFPGGYRYVPSPGYLGDDTFTLKICGALNGVFEGCADLLFSVTVVPPGA